MSTFVAADTTNLTPDSGATITPGETFSFRAHAKNALLGVRVVKVIYHVTIEPASVAKLIVPANPPARASRFLSAPLLAPGSLVSGMFLFPQDKALEPGDEDEIPGLKGKAIAIGFANLRCQVHADIDLASVFPPDNLSDSGALQVPVV